MANLDWLTGLDLSDFGTKKEDGFDWLDDNTISSFNKSIGTQNTGAGTTLAPISSSLPSPKLDFKIEPIKENVTKTTTKPKEIKGFLDDVPVVGGIMKGVEGFTSKYLDPAFKNITDVAFEKPKQEDLWVNQIKKIKQEGIKNFADNTIKNMGEGLSDRITAIGKVLSDPLIMSEQNIRSGIGNIGEGEYGKGIGQIGRGLIQPIMDFAMSPITLGGAIQYGQDGIKKGEDIATALFNVPVAMFGGITEGLKASGMDDEDAQNYAMILGTARLGGLAKIKGTKPTDLTIMDEANYLKNMDNGIKAEVPPTVKKMWIKYNAKIKPDFFPDEYKSQATELNAKLNSLYQEKQYGDMEGIMKEINSFLDYVKQEEFKKKYPGFDETKGGYINLGVLDKMFEQNDLSKINKTIEDLKNTKTEKQITRNDIEDLVMASGIFAGNSIKQEFAIDKIEQELSGEIPKGSITEYVQEGVSDINRGREKFDIGRIEDSTKSIESIIKDVLPEDKFSEVMNEIDRMKNIITDYQYQIPKIKGLEDYYGKDLLSAVTNLKLNLDKTKGQEALDRYTAIEENKGLNKTFQSVYDNAKEFITSRNLDISVDELVQEVIDKLNQPSSRITKTEALNRLEKNKEPIKDVTETDKMFLKQIETKKEPEIIKVARAGENFKKSLGEKQKLGEGVYVTRADRKDILDIYAKQKGVGIIYGSLEGRNIKKYDSLFKFQQEVIKNSKELGLKGNEFKKGVELFNEDLKKQGYDGIELPDEIMLFEEGKVIPEKTEVPKKPSITKPSEKIKAKKEIKSSEENLGKIAEELKKLSKKVKITDIAELIEKHGEAIMFKALDYGVKKNIFKAEEVKEFKEAIPKITKREDQAPTGRLSPEQRLEIQDMLGYDKLFKKIEEQKIITKEVEEGLKATDSRLHIVNAPETKRVKLPFSLMGNKSATFKQILLPMVKKATEKGAETYVEPFGGAGTVYYFVDDMVTSGIKEFNINHFDNEKYEVIKAIKDEKMKDIRGEVNEAYTTIINDISEVLVEIPEAKEIMNAYGLEARGQYFKDIAETFFYPEYAKQFFEERPDTKLAIKGELTTTFKEWLSEHIQEKYKDLGKELTPEENEQAVDLILSDTSVFENKYPEISKKIGNILDKYDGVDFEKGDYKKAMQVAMARHFRQRGDSGQKVVSASSGFQNVIGIKDKMIEGLEKYQETFQKHGDKINIYNMDGKEFIKEMGKTKDDNKTISYFDPPYIRTTGVYIKNQPKEIQNSLEEYADPTKIDQLFNPLKDTIMMFTNDVNGKYFETLNSMTDRMSKNIIAYKEGTTPTSLLFTKEIEVTPKQVGLNYYSIVKDKFIKDIQKSLEDGLLPTISAQMKKQLAKFEQHIINAYKEKFGDLTKIQDQVYEGKKAFENLQEGLLEITSLKDRQKIISEAKKWLKQNKVTGNDVIKMIDKINKLWIQRQAEIKDIKGLLAEAKKTDTISADIKKELFDFINQNYATKKISSTFQKDIESIDKIESGLEFNENDLGVYEKYLSDRKYNEQINEARKQNIYDLDLDQLHNLRQTISEYIQFGKDSRKYENFQTETIVKNLVKKYGNETKKVKSFQNTTSRILQAQRVKNTGMGKIVDGILNFKEHKSKKLLLDILPPDWVLDEELGIHRLVYETKNEALGRFRDYQEEIRKETTELEKKLKLDKNSKIKITLHGLSKRGDGKGISKIFAYLKTIGDPFTKEPLSMEEIKTRMEEYSKDDFLNKEEKEMYDYMTGKFEEIGNKVRSVKLKVDNQIMRKMNNYFPIKIDIGRNPEKFTGTTEPDISERKVDLFRTTEPTSGFTKEATAVELIPELDSLKIFYNHMEKASYYSEMQEQIKILNEAINKLGSEKLGDLGYGYAKDYVNTLARQGILETNVSQYGRRLAKINRNFQQSVLGYSLQTMLLQTSAIIQAKNVGINLGIQNLPKMNKKTWQMINEKSALMRHREMKLMFGYEGNKLDYGWLDKFNKVGFIPMQFIDTFMTKWMWLNKYNEGIKKGLLEKEAIYEADRDITKALANSHFDGKSNFILKHERGRASFLTMFQTFISYQFANLFYGGGKIREKISGKYGKYIFTAVVLGLIMATYEELLRRGIKKNVYGKETEGGMIESILSNMIGYIPFLNTFYGVSKYGAPATFQGTTDILKGFTEGLEAYQSETKDMTPTKIINLLAGFATLFGIAGTSEAEKWAKKIFGEVKTKKESGGTIGIGDLDLNKLDLNGLGEIPDLGDINIGGIGDLDLSGL